MSLVGLNYQLQFKNTWTKTSPIVKIEKRFQLQAISYNSNNYSFTSDPHKLNSFFRKVFPLSFIAFACIYAAKIAFTRFD